MKTGYVWIPGEPLSGIYTYSLIASGKVIDRKRMVAGIEPVHRWVSPSGTIFEDVSILSTEKDTLYLSKSKGLLRYAPNPEVSNYEEWLLLPEN